MIRNLFIATMISLPITPIFSQTLQNDLRIGGGYFGESTTHPGFTINVEYVRNHTTQISTPVRADFGAYFHPRNHNAIMFDMSAGLREKFGNRFALEQYFGMGTLISFYNGDGLFQVSESGGIERVSNSGNPKFMPSISVGIWIASGKKDDPERWAVYFRPKLFWQIPYNNLAMPNFALQAGVTYRIKTFSKKAVGVRQ